MCRAFFLLSTQTIRCRPAGAFLCIGQLFYRHSAPLVLKIILNRREFWITECAEDAEGAVKRVSLKLSVFWVRCWMDVSFPCFPRFRIAECAEDTEGSESQKALKTRRTLLRGFRSSCLSFEWEVGCSCLFRDFRDFRDSEPCFLEHQRCDTVNCLNQDFQDYRIFRIRQWTFKVPFIG